MPAREWWDVAWGGDRTSRMRLERFRRTPWAMGVRAPGVCAVRGGHALLFPHGARARKSKNTLPLRVMWGKEVGGGRGVY
jgi:hypothetical protein